MQYRSVRLGHRILFIPDFDYRHVLKWKLKSLRLARAVRSSPISTFEKKGNPLRDLLLRHRGDRFFVVIDFVHAFHQIDRQMVAEVFPEISDRYYEICFVELGDKEEVIPIGFNTSNYLFEALMTRLFDVKLMAWQEDCRGTVTRNSDNILATWQKDIPDAFCNLLAIFEGFQIRVTPKEPRRWREPIRFCGAIIPKNEVSCLSRRKRKKMMHEARAKSWLSEQGVSRFIETWM